MNSKRISIICFAISVFIWLFDICFMEHMASEIIEGFISSGMMERKYLTFDGWIFNYDTVYKHNSITIIYILLMYFLLIKFKNKKICVLTTVLYVLIVGYLIFQYQYIMFILACPTCIIVILSIVAMKYN